MIKPHMPSSLLFIAERNAPPNNKSSMIRINSVTPVFTPKKPSLPIPGIRVGSIT